MSEKKIHPSITALTISDDIHQWQNRHREQHDGDAAYQVFF